MMYVPTVVRLCYCYHSYHTGLGVSGYYVCLDDFIFLPDSSVFSRIIEDSEI